MSGERETSSILKVNYSKTFTEVDKILREVELNKQVVPDFSPYRNAKITLERMKISDLYPCALYVLNDNLKRAGEVRDELLKQGIDIFNLTEAQSLINFNYKGREGINLSPPLVEVSADDGYKNVVVDGGHRVTKAKLLGEEEITVLKVEGSAAPLPALPVGWEDMKILDEVPAVKRIFRFNEMKEIRKWVANNYSRYVQGFDFPELQWARGVYPEQSFTPDFSVKERVAAIVPEQGKVLMVQRADSGLWGLPAGGVEPYDAPSYKVSGMPVRRELFEETGLIGLAWRLISHFESGNNIGWIYEVSVADDIHVNMTVKDYVEAFNSGPGNTEVSKLGLFDLGEIRELNKSGKLFKPQYNLRALEDFFIRRADGSLDNVEESFAAWDAPNCFWEHQESFKPTFPLKKFNKLEHILAL